MIITCPECLTKYRLDENLISPEGNRVRCSKCRHIFQVRKSAPSEQPPPSPPVIEPPLPDYEEKGLPKKISRGRFWVGRRGAIFIIILAGLGLMVFSYNREISLWEKAEELKKLTFSIQVWGQSLMGKNPYIKNFLSGLPFFKPYLRIPVEPEGTISLGKVKGYYLENNQFIKLLIIEGQAVNHWTEPRSFIKVKGTLFNSQGEKVEEKSAYCGNILSENDLKELSLEAIDKSLSSQFGISFSNVNIPPQASVPFMIVFMDVTAARATGNSLPHPEGKPNVILSRLSDFTVEVVNSQKGSQ